eukprot:TRINITY_DN14208_c0_g1_i1.p1 TRINITY_DN14208_c0_g1~~TRINITY_DN14208_c0_g1_i1.p1  ORF type:complete len:238 (-),score=54.32 TRINITY_DN14208_c0_g1_i1:325-1038(-)
MIRRPPRSTLSSSSAASDVYKRQYQRRVRGQQCSRECQSCCEVMGNQSAVPRTRVTTVVAQQNEGLDDDIAAMQRIPKFTPPDPSSLRKSPVSFSTLRKSERVRTDVFALNEETISSPVVSICAQYREFCRRWNEPTMHSQTVLMAQIRTVETQSHQAVAGMQSLHADVRRLEGATNREVPGVTQAVADMSERLVETVSKLEELNLLLPEEHRLVPFGEFCTQANVKDAHDVEDDTA